MLCLLSVIADQNTYNISEFTNKGNFQSMMDMNIQVFRAINNLGTDYSFLNPFFIFIAEYTLALLIFAMLFYWFTRVKTNRLMVIAALLSVALAEIIGKSISMLHFNYQPFVVLSDVNQLIEKEVGNSFPSDHTIIFFAVCFTLFFFKSRFKYFWVGLALLVGLSRMWVGVHYPADVLTGAFVAVGSAYICYKLIPKSRGIQRLLSKTNSVQQ